MTNLVLFHQVYNPPDAVYRDINAYNIQTLKTELDLFEYGQ